MSFNEVTLLFVAVVAATAGAGVSGVAVQSEPPCSPPDGIQHGLTDWDGKSGVARYACFQGFHLVGPPQVECRYGRWYSDTPVALPTCKPVVCNHPNIDRGRLETGENVRYRSGEQAVVVCTDGYELRTGSGKVICKEDGSWESAEQSEFPVCKEKICPYPDNSIPVIENGSLDINGNRHGPNGGYKPGAVANYDCNPGFVLVPLSAGKRVCHKGKWEGHLPACVAQATPPESRTHCPAPMSISNGYYFTDRSSSDAPLALPKVIQGNEQYERGTIARYHCKEGYSLSSFHGQEIYRCLSNGEWSPRVPPVCITFGIGHHEDPLEEVMCPSPPTIPYADFERVEGWLTSNGAIHGTILEYSCRVGYRDSRTPCLPTRRTCHAGQWIGRKPSCVPFDYCERPPVLSHGFMKSSPENAYHVLSLVEYGCHPGYLLKGSPSLKCHANGCWMPNELPECIREELYESGWSVTGDESSVPVMAILVSISVSCALLALLTTVCLVVVCRRKGGPVPPPAGPAHWSTTVTVTPECRPREALNGNGGGGAGPGGGSQGGRRQEQDRMALIAFADGVQQVTLPSYEEALRDSTAAPSSLSTGHLSEYDNPITTAAGANGHLTAAPAAAAAAAAGYRHFVQSRHGGSAGRVPGSHGNGTGGRRSRHPAGGSSNGSVVSNGGGGGGQRYDNADAVSHHSVHAWPPRPTHRRRRENNSLGGNANIITGGNNSTSNTLGNNHPSGSVNAGSSDALSDSISHHSIHMWPCRQQSGQSGSASLRSSSAAGGSAETVGGQSCGQASHTSTASGAATTVSCGSSDNTQTTCGGGGGGSSVGGQGDGISAGGNSSQTPSCRALAGSLASFDTSSAVNTEGVPLLEENELETEGSSSSVSGGDTGSATYSEASSKT